MKLLRPILRYYPCSRHGTGTSGSVRDKAIDVSGRLHITELIKRQQASANV
jgi:hypothetical protein